jgi:RNA binding exosome subunit
MKKRKQTPWHPFTNKPCEPYPPQKTMTAVETISKHTISSYESLNIPENADTVTIEVEEVEGYYGKHENVIYVSFDKTGERENPNYETEYEKYLKQLAQYKLDMKEYRKKKKVYDEEQRIKTLEEKRYQLERLKKKLGEE